MTDEQKDDENYEGSKAVEFLMNYGWAILIVLAAILSLFYFGVLGPRVDEYNPAEHQCTEWTCEYDGGFKVTAMNAPDFCAVKIKVGDNTTMLSKQTCNQFHEMTDCEKKPNQDGCVCTLTKEKFTSFSGAFEVNWTKYSSIYADSDPATITLKDCFNSKSCVPLEGKSNYTSEQICVRAEKVAS